MIDTFTGWIGCFPIQTEKAEEVVKTLLHETILRFGLPRSLQSDKGISFTCKSPKGSLKHRVLLTTSLCLEASAFKKSKTIQTILEISDKKIAQETSLGWKEALPIALLYTCIAPKEQIGLSPYEMLYGRPLVYINNLFLDSEAQTLQSYTMAIEHFQQDICLWGVNQDPKYSKEPSLYAPGTQVLTKVWKDESPKAQLQPTCKVPFPVILSTPEAVKVPGHDSWIHYS